MAQSFRTTIFNASLLCATGLILGGCSDGAKPPAAAQTAPPEQTPEQKFAALLKLAKSGDANAQFNLGMILQNGFNFDKDGKNLNDQAAEWLHKAANQGHVEAQYNLGVMYRAGNGVRPDMAKEVEWYEKAAAQGHAKSQHTLGVMYYFGLGVPADAAKAVEWYKKAAIQGVEMAQYLLGVSYADGDGVTKDAAKAVEWWQKAAAQGNADAQFNLGVRYNRGKGVPKDAAKAVEWWQKAAAQGKADAQYNLGVMYFTGEGVTKDTTLAYAWFNLAAIGGDASALKNRGITESRLTGKELAEAQRLSSNWKKGTLLTREGASATSSQSSVETPGVLSKKGTGTAFLVAKSGYAITNHHVTNGCKEVRIQGRDGAAKMVTSDTVNDLALLQLTGTVNATAPLNAEPSKLRQGEDVVVYGFPLNSILSSGGNFTPGVVSAMTGLGNNTNQIQITAPIQPGSSGSSVLNKKGEVVGVVSMKLSDSAMAKATGQVGQNVNFAVSGQTLKTFLDTNKVPYTSGGGFFSRDKSTADLAEEARKWTLLVECWK